MATYTFDTVADMKKSTALSINDIIYTLGYESVADGGAEKYIIISDGIDQDGTNYIKLTGTNYKAKIFETPRQYMNQILTGSTSDPLLLGSDSETYPAGTYARDVDGVIKRAIAEFDNGNYSSGSFDANFEFYGINETSSNTEKIIAYDTVSAVTDTFTIDFDNNRVKNVTMETEDADAKTVAVSNIPTRTELFIELIYTNAAAITWFSGITWLAGSAPTLEAGKTYRMAFFTSDGGTSWHGNSVGGW